MDNNLEPNVNNSSSPLQQVKGKKYIPYIIFTLIFIVLQFFIIKSDKDILLKFIFSYVLFYIFIVAVLVYRSILLKKIRRRIKFYPNIIFQFIILFFAVLILLSNLLTKGNPGSLGLGGIGIFIGLFVLHIILLLVSFIFYEVTHYIVFRKNTNIELKGNNTSGENIVNKVVGIGTKLFSIFLLGASFAFLFDYLKLFINNYKYVKLLRFVNNLKDYRLDNLSVKEIFISPYIFFIYVFIIISCITIIKSFKNSKSTSIFISISILFFAILFIGMVSYGSEPNIYFNTIYQDGDFYNGKINQGNAFDILKTDQAIKEKNINLCSQVGYVYYRKYCEEKISSQ
jgi:hypothetical protein